MNGILEILLEIVLQNTYEKLTRCTSIATSRFVFLHLHVHRHSLTDSVSSQL